MRINFYPSRSKMLREIEKCISEGKLDILLSFCKSCVFSVFTNSKEPECRTCTIKQGIENPVGRRTVKILESKEVFNKALAIK